MKHGLNTDFSCVLFLLDCIFQAVLPASGQTAPAEVIRQTFQELKNKIPEMSSRDTAAISVVQHPAFWLCSDGATTLSIDRNGNVSYKKTFGWSNQSVLDLLTQTNSSKSAADQSSNDAKLIEETRRLATTLLTPEQATSFKPFVKHEILLLAQLPDGQISKSPGRIIIRLYAPKQFLSLGYFQAVFDPNDKLQRIDLECFESSQGKSLAKVLFPTDLPLPPSYRLVGAKPFTLGCFFSPAEYRFEVSAFHTEDEPLLNVQATSNPYSRDNFDVSSPWRTSVPLYVQSKDYHWWSWQHWQQYGRVGTFRGSWVLQNGVGSWENSNQVLFHRSLASYGFIQGLPTKTRMFDKDGPLDSPKKYPFGSNFDYTQAFFDDLEKCSVAFFFTHGGLVDGKFQLQQQLDIWANFMPQQRSLGEGKLRHLFIEACSGFAYLREPQNAHLLETWIRGAQIDGLRTVCGIDGEETSLEAVGWEFFGYYNKWESISDAWVFGQLDENPAQFPVTVSYGETPEEAVDTLLHGRFSDERAGAKYIVVSDWTSISKK